jgi:hypothetical protein
MCAEPIKIGDISFDLAIKILCSGIDNFINTFHFHVTDSETFSANKMVMPGCICVKMIRTVSGRNLFDFPQFCQEGKISVNSSQTDPRIRFTKTGINGLGSGMIRPPGQKIFDGLSLPAVF